MNYLIQRVYLDTEGNLRSLLCRGNIVMQYKYDMHGNVVYQNSMMRTTVAAQQYSRQSASDQG
jgi:YD repeat-containing protein